MIYIHTTRAKFENGKKLILSHGGIIAGNRLLGKECGTITLKMMMQKIVVDYTFEDDGGASFRVVSLPFFLTDNQVAVYLKKILS